MKCLIVDDNEMARLTLHHLAAQTGVLEEIHECKNAIEAHHFITSHPIDLLFLDIEMPGMTGIELLRSLPRKPLVIFTTSNKDYAAEAFELHVVDYLVKPFTLPRLLAALEKVREIRARGNAELRAIENEYLFIKDNGVLKKIKLDEILWMEAMGDYIKIHVSGKWYIVHTTLKAAEEKIASGRFMRVHRSYIVALDKIDAIEDGVLTIMGKPVPVAEGYRAQLMQKLNLL
ncbi:MAG: LytTR family DNA-binding domain-containing protein [Chitinophagaceae bacterium]